MGSSSSPVSGTHAARRAPIRTATLLVGVVFLLVGVLGFIPGVTTHYDQMDLAGHHSMAMLLGLFSTSVLHNIVHLLYGVVGLLMARTVATARAYLLVGGAIYLALWIYGLVIDQQSIANFVPLNTADNWLHFGLGVGMVVLGLILDRARVTSPAHPVRSPHTGSSA